MYVTDVALYDFRSYRQAVLHLEPGITTLIGSNGQGKTNLLEAIAYFSTLSSHRVGSDTALVRFDPITGQQASAGVVRLRVNDCGREQLADIEIVAGRANRARLNSNVVRPREIAGVVRSVVFAPEDLALVRLEPGVRRRFLDDLVMQIFPAYAATITEHERVLKQRGALLKQLRSSGAGYRGVDAATDAMLSVWDEQLAGIASQIIVARRDLVRELQPLVKDAYAAVSQGTRALNVAYIADSLNRLPKPTDTAVSDSGSNNDTADATAIAAELIEVMRLRRNEEIQRGVNLVGAHRDDLALQLGDLPVKGFASHGESWSVALSLRIACFRLLSERELGPILMLDDVFAELDATRRTAVAAVAAEAEQVLITAAVESDVPQELRGRRLYVSLNEHSGTLVVDPATVADPQVLANPATVVNPQAPADSLSQQSSDTVKVTEVAEAVEVAEVIEVDNG